MPNPQMQEAMRAMQPHDVFMFWMQQPEFLEDSDQATLKKDFTSMGKYFFLGTIAGVLLNVQVKRIPKINILNWNRLIRYTVRVPLFFLP